MPFDAFNVLLAAMCLITRIECKVDVGKANIDLDCIQLAIIWRPPFHHEGICQSADDQPLIGSTIRSKHYTQFEWEQFGYHNPLSSINCTACQESTMKSIVECWSWRAWNVRCYRSIADTRILKTEIRTTLLPSASSFRVTTPLFCDWLYPWSSLVCSARRRPWRQPKLYVCPTKMEVPILQPMTRLASLLQSSETVLAKQLTVLQRILRRRIWQYRHLNQISRWMQQQYRRTRSIMTVRKQLPAPVQKTMPRNPVCV